MERMERLMEGMSRSAAASAQAIQSFVGQGEFIVFLDFISLILFPLPWGQLSDRSPLFIGRGLGESRRFPAGFPELCHRASARGKSLVLLGDSNKLFGLIFLFALVPSSTGSLVTCGHTDLFLGWLGFSLKIVSGSPLGSVEWLHVHTRLFHI
jgi:hypothetical protein